MPPRGLFLHAIVPASDKRLRRTAAAGGARALGSERLRTDALAFFEIQVPLEPGDLTFELLDTRLLRSDRGLVLLQQLPRGLKLPLYRTYRGLDPNANGATSEEAHVLIDSDATMSLIEH